jgi:Flp pilus assembly protein TadD
VAIELDPHAPDVYLYRGEARLVNGDPGGALADCDTAVKLGPDMADAYRGLAAVHIARRDFTLALTDLHNAIRLDPTDATSISHAATDERAVYANRGRRKGGHCPGASDGCNQQSPGSLTPLVGEEWPASFGWMLVS